MASINPPPYKVPLIDKTGIVNQTWAAWFRDMFNRSGGASIDTTLAEHLVDSIDAHDASAISNSPNGNLAATNVQTALNEIQTDVDLRATSAALSSHTGNTSNPHATTADQVLPSQTSNSGKYLTTNGTTSSWASVSASSAIRSEVRLHTVGASTAAYGSTNAAIRRYTTTIKNVGTAITYADSATLGASFTINEDGIYAVGMMEPENTTVSSAIAAITLNSSELNTSPLSITNVADILSSWAWNAAVNGAATASTSWTGFLAAGAIVRPHTRPATTPGVLNRGGFWITKVNN